MTELQNESDLIAAIERLELDVRDTRRRIEHARTEADKRVLNRQIGEALQQIENLRARLKR
jgi:outer membrane murein-binding lipoprotein Lpp